MKSPDQAAFKAILIVTMILAIVLLPAVARANPGMQSGPPAFEEIDIDGDGFVSEEEFTTFREARMAAMAEAGMPMKAAAIAPAFVEIDTDGDGMLTETEFLTAQQAHRKAMHEKMAAAHGGGMGMHHGGGKGMPTFEQLDLNGDGCIDADEFAKHQAERHGAPKQPVD
jgi:hypothetical protein